MWTVLFVCWAFFNLYIHAAAVYRAYLRGRLRGVPLLLAAPVVVVAALLDVLLQLTVASVVFWRKPEDLRKVEWRTTDVLGLGVPLPIPQGDWTITSRLKRYLKAGPTLGWRYKWAATICYRFADPFDYSGAHCDDESAGLKPVTRADSW